MMAKIIGNRSIADCPHPSPETLAILLVIEITELETLIIWL